MFFNLATRAIHARSAVRQQEAIAPKIDSALSAFGARIGLQSLNPAVLEQAVTHSSAEENKGNQDLVLLGECDIYIKELVKAHVTDGDGWVGNR